MTLNQELVDNIAAPGATIDTKDITLYILNGSASHYQAFKTVICTNL